MLDGDSHVLNPFTNRVVTEFDVTCCFGSHVVGPLNARVIVIIEKDQFIQIRDRKTGLGETKVKIS